MSDPASDPIATTSSGPVASPTSKPTATPTTSNPMAALDVITGQNRAAAALSARRAPLLRALAEGDDSAAGLARRLGLPRQQVNYHLRELEKEKLVELVEERRKGNCTERVLRATARTFVLSPELLGAPLAAGVADRFSSTYLVAVAARAVGDVAQLRERAARHEKKLATLTLEAEVRFASAEARAAFAEELSQSLAALAAKYHDDTAPDGRLYRFFAGGYPAVTRDLGDEP